MGSRPKSLIAAQIARGGRLSGLSNGDRQCGSNLSSFAIETFIHDRVRRAGLAGKACAFTACPIDDPTKTLARAFAGDEPVIDVSHSYFDAVAARLARLIGCAHITSRAVSLVG